MLVTVAQTKHHHHYPKHRNYRSQFSFISVPPRMQRDHSPRPIVCTLCKNRQKSFLFKELDDELYKLTSERLTFQRNSYFCLICIQKLNRKFRRVKREPTMCSDPSDEEVSSSSESEAIILNEMQSRQNGQNGRWSRVAWDQWAPLRPPHPPPSLQPGPIQLYGLMQ